MADVASAAGTAGELLREMSLIACPQMDALASVSFSGRVDGQTGGWQGAPAATPGGATVLRKEGGGNGKNSCWQSGLFVSVVWGRKEVKHIYLGNLLDLVEKLEKCVLGSSCWQFVVDMKACCSCFGFCSIFTCFCVFLYCAFSQRPEKYWKMSHVPGKRNTGAFLMC